MAEILRAENLDIGYGQTPVVKNIGFTLGEGEVLVLAGPNGSGKSTLLRTLTGELPPLGGRVFLEVRELRTVPAGERARSMAILMTDRVRPERMRCRDVVMMGRYPYTGYFGAPGERDKSIVREAMALAGVEELAERDFLQISDGQRQLVMLARAIAQEPKLLVLDEPASFLDVRHRLSLLEILRVLAGERGVAVIASIHELELARRAADRILCLREGAVDRIGTREDICESAYLRKLYGVPASEAGLFREVYGDAGEGTEKSVRSGKKMLRTGYTTGTCAALAAAGALRLLLGTGSGPLSLRTPKGVTVEVEPSYIRREEEAAVCGVRKDAGDDPDITDGVIVEAKVRLGDGGVVITGGEGVGRVTDPVSTSRWGAPPSTASPGG